MVCIFFGHRDCYGLDKVRLCKTIEDMIEQGADTFYVGHQGQFDSMVFSCLLALKERHPHICIGVVLAYLPAGQQEQEPFCAFTMYPEGMENCPRKFAIERRNSWLIRQGRGGHCVCWVNHSWGGAYKFAARAKRSGLTVINLGTAQL